MRAKKSRAIESPSPVHTAHVAEDGSRVIEVIESQTQQDSELETGVIAGKKMAKKKLRPSQIDSGILMDEEEADLSVGQAPRRKTSSRGASVKQELPVTRAYPSGTKSPSSNSDMQTSDVKYKQNTSQKFVTFVDERDDETLPEKSSSDSRATLTSDSQLECHGNLRNVVSEFDDTHDKELANADNHLEFLRKGVKRPQLKKKQTRKEVDKQRRISRRRIVGDSETADNDYGRHNANDEFIMIDSSGDKPPPSANDHQLPPSNQHAHAGIVVIMRVVQEFFSEFFVNLLTFGIFLEDECKHCVCCHHLRGLYYCILTY